MRINASPRFGLVVLKDEDALKKLPPADPVRQLAPYLAVAAEQTGKSPWLKIHLTTVNGKGDVLVQAQEDNPKKPISPEAGTTELGFLDKILTHVGLVPFSQRS